MRATYQQKATGKVVVRLVSNAKVAQVRFRRKEQRITIREELRRGHGRVVLRRNATSIRARALRTKNLSRSPWVVATKADRPPAVNPVRTDLSLAARQRVFFGHQSVGRNILGSIPVVYRSHDLSPPPILPAPETTQGGFVSEAEIGENAEPLLKISDFARRLRGGIARDVDVALMKLCYVDVHDGTNVRAIFNAYAAMVRALAAQYPDLVLVHVTTPLTTDSPSDNLARERLNRLMRERYADTGRLFDLAKVESTKPNGTRVEGIVAGERYFALYRGYAADNGHLNERGSAKAATALLRVIARSARN